MYALLSYDVVSSCFGLLGCSYTNYSVELQIPRLTRALSITSLSTHECPHTARVSIVFSSQ